MERKKRKKAVANLIMATVTLTLYLAGLVIYNFYYIKGLNRYFDILKMDISMIDNINSARTAANSEFIFYEGLFLLIGIGLVFIESRTIKKLLEIYKNIAYKDILTGCRSRESLESYFEKIQKRKKSRSLTYFLFDINHLKDINDCYGKDKGDGFLKTLADILDKVFDGSSVYRISGGEFAVVNNSETDPYHMMDKVCEEIAQYNRKKNSTDIPLSISKGFSQYTYNAKEVGLFDHIHYLASKSLQEDVSTFRRVLPRHEQKEIDEKNIVVRKL